MTKIHHEMCLVLVQISEPGPNGKWVWKIKPQNQLFKVDFNSFLLFLSCSVGNFYTYKKFHSRKWKIKSTWRTHVNQRQELMNIKSLEPQRFFKNLQFLPIDKTTFFFKFLLACNHPTSSSSFILFFFLAPCLLFLLFWQRKRNDSVEGKKVKKRQVCLTKLRDIPIFPNNTKTTKNCHMVVLLSII